MRKTVVLGSLACAVVGVVWGGCGSGFEEAAPASTSSTTTSTTSTSSTGGASSVSTTGGGSMSVSVGSAMGGGVASSTGAVMGCGTCAADELCDMKSNTCVKCNADFNKLDFEAPQPLAISLPGTGVVLYPREEPKANGFLYAYQSATNGPLELAETTTGSAPLWKNGTALASLEATPGVSDWAPLLIPANTAFSNYQSGITLKNDPLLIFTRFASGTKIVFTEDRISVHDVDIVNAQDTNIDLAVAYAIDPPRLYWTRVGNGESNLMMADIAGNAQAQQIALMSAMCPIKGASSGSYAPWVDPTGRVLLFQGSYDDTCTLPSKPVHLFYVLLDANGKPSGDAKRLFPNDADTMYTPSLNANGCGVYYSRGIENPVSVTIEYAARK